MLDQFRGNTLAKCFCIKYLHVDVKQGNTDFVIHTLKGTVLCE